MEIEPIKASILGKLYYDRFVSSEILKKYTGVCRQTLSKHLNDLLAWGYVTMKIGYKRRQVWQKVRDVELDTDLSHMELRVLRHLSYKVHMSVATLAQSVRKGQTYIGSLLYALEHKGLVVKKIGPKGKRYWKRLFKTLPFAEKIPQYKFIETSAGHFQGVEVQDE